MPAFSTNRIAAPDYDILHTYVRFAPRRYVLCNVEIKLRNPEAQSFINAFKGGK